MICLHSKLNFNFYCNSFNIYFIHILINIKNYIKNFRFAIKNLNSIVEHDYVLILFCSDTVHKPSWAWVIQTYKTLERKYV